VIESADFFGFVLRRNRTIAGVMNLFYREKRVVYPLTIVNALALQKIEVSSLSMKTLCATS